MKVNRIMSIKFWCALELFFFFFFWSTVVFACTSCTHEKCVFSFSLHYEMQKVGSVSTHSATHTCKAIYYKPPAGS